MAYERYNANNAAMLLIDHQVGTIDWSMSPLLVGLPRVVTTLAVVIILSGFLAYPVMPFVTRLFQPWLYPRP